MPTDNTNLTTAKKRKQDEFYTTYDTVEKELSLYDYTNKIVLCNCNDSTNSSYFQYFHLNFNKLKLKKLYCIYREESEDDFFFPYKGCLIEYNGENDEDLEVYKKKYLNGTGDFRDKDCLTILESSDIVCTNPPFSLFRQFIDVLYNYKKQFIILGNINMIPYKNIMPKILKDQLYLGKSINCNSTVYFKTPYKDYESDRLVESDDNGSLQSFGQICWFTTMKPKKDQLIPEPLKMPLNKKYIKEEYNEYLNYPNAINVNRVEDIPYDFNGIIGVPFTFLFYDYFDKYKLLGYRYGLDNKDLIYLDKTTKEVIYPYNRILIQKL